MLYPITCDLFIDKVTGKVGMGTCDPFASLDIRRSDATGNLLAVSDTTGTGVYFQLHTRNLNLEGSGPGEYSALLDMQVDNSNLSVLGFNYEGYDSRVPGTLYYRNTVVFDGKQHPMLYAQGSSGNVGIGTVTPSERLQVIGNICATGSITTCSDARFKKNVDVIAEPIAKLAQLRGVEFDWNRDEFPDHKFSGERQIGLVAQEVKEVVPAVVSKGSDGFYSVDYGRLVPLLVEAMKAQQAEIESLKSEVATLKAKR